MTAAAEPYGRKCTRINANENSKASKSRTWAVLNLGIRVHLRIFAAQLVFHPRSSALICG
jgi:hypothetical protein